MTLHVTSHGAGPDLVLLHGWGMHGGVWDEAVPMLAESMRVHVVDLPGHGLSSGPPPAGFDEAVDVVARHLPGSAVVCGWSLGGLVAQRLARRHPARVRGLVLVSSTPCFVEGDDWPHAMKPSTLETFARGLEDDPAATLGTFVKLNALNGARGRAAIREFTQRLARRPPPAAGTLARGLEWLRTTDLRSDAAWLAMPALVLHGARDAIVPRGAGQWLEQCLPHATRIEWDDAAHLPFFTHREAFVAALESFVA
jgi:pimeloyl-[acyl-carrier protein] methyl ester esterase